MSPKAARVVKSQRVLVSGQSQPTPQSLLIEGEKIYRIGPFEENYGESQIDDFGELVISAGLVDTHAHINEPGRTEWEGFVTATRSAAAGGITTVIDMPLNSIPATTTAKALAIKKASAKNNCTIDYGFWGGVVPGNLNELVPLIEGGVMGFKSFLCPSGVDEFPHVNESDLRAALPVLAKYKLPLIVHAEIESPLPASELDQREYQGYLNSRPPKFELDAIRLMIKLCRETGCRVHIVHLSSAQALADIRQARAEGLPFTAETCPHYLSFAAEEIPNGATHFKCAPPIRDQANQEALWGALKEDLIEFIVSDHSPCTPHLKHLDSGDFSQAWGGIAGLQFSRQVVWTEMKKRGFSLADLDRLMAFQTARWLGLADKKGQIRVGNDADFVVWDPERRFTLDADHIYHRHKVTPYLGKTLLGAVHKTYLRGYCVYSDSEAKAHFLEKPLGVEVLRK